MFISEEQSRKILSNPRNLANRFKNGQEIKNAAIIESGISAAEEKEEISSPQTEESECFENKTSRIEHRELKRPGNNRPWLSKQERDSIAADYTLSRGGIFTETKVTQSDIAEKYGVQVSTVSDIVNGTRRVPDGPRSVDQSKVDKALDEVREKAIDKLMAGLGQLTEDKISSHNGKDISLICANISRVVQSTVPQEKAAQQINLVVYTPELRAEKNFDIVEI